MNLCICLACGPPWRNEEPTPEKDSASWFLGPSWMPLCPRCGSKRCAGAVNHNNECTETEKK